MNAYKLEDVDHLYNSFFVKDRVVYTAWGQQPSLFRLDDVEALVAILTLWEKLLDLFPVLCLTIVVDPANNSGIINELKYQHMVAVGQTTMGVEREQNKTLRTLPWGTMIEDHDTGNVITNSIRLRSVDQETQHSIVDGGLEAKVQMFRGELIPWAFLFCQTRI